MASLPASLTTQPNAISGQTSYSGSHLLIEVRGNTAVGTITITGKDFTQAQNAATETTNSIPVAGTPSNPTGIYRYETSAIFSVVNASGVTVTGLTNGLVRIYAIQAPRSLEPAMFEFEEKFPPFSPEEQRGLTSRDTNIVQLVKQVDIGKIEQVFYPDTNIWIPYVAFGSTPSQATMPATPTVLKASAAVSGGPFSLTTQPNTIGPGSLLQFVVTSSSAVGTIAVTGTNVLNQTITETVPCGVPGAANGNGTFYTQQVFASVAASGVAFTGLTGGSVAVNGAIGVQSTWLGADSGTGASSSLYSACIEWFDGTDVVSLPWSFFTEVTLEGSVEKEMKWSAKGQAQDMISIGDKTTTPMNALSRATPLNTNVGAFSNLWQPFDINAPSWMANCWIDPLSGTPGSTAYNFVLDWKITWKIPQKASYTATNTQRFSKVYRQRRETELDLTVIFDDLVQYENFKMNFVKQLVNFQFASNAYLGVYNSTPTYKNWNVVFAAKTIEAKRDASKEKVEAKLKLKTEYTPVLGYEYKVVIQNQVPPTFNS